MTATTSTRTRRTPATPRTVPEQDPGFAHLTLSELRAYRGALQEEETKVSYWRRILQARLDTVRAGRLTTSGTLDARRLAPVLSDRRVTSGRSALLDVLPADDIPPLPSLAGLWERQVPEDDPAALAAFETDLAEAEQQLSQYRTALHLRLADATGQLIARYRENPSLCLSALPLDETA